MLHHELNGIVGHCLCNGFEDKYSAQLNGIDEYINFGSVAVETTGAFSVSAWIRLANPIQAGVILGNKDQGSTGGWILSVATANNDLQMGGVDTDGHYIVKRSGINAVIHSTWYHIVGVFNGTFDASGFTIYLNNSPIALPNTYSSGVCESFNTSNPLAIGLAETNRYFKGIIDDVSKWPFALTADEVAELYNLGVPGNLREHSRWNDFRSNSRSLWVTFEHDSFDQANKVRDLSDNHHLGSAVNMSNATNKITTVPG